MDDTKPPGIGEELEKLQRELKQITSMPAATPAERESLLQVLESFEKEWKEKQGGGEVPEWRRGVDAAIGAAFAALNAEVRAGRQIDQPTLKRHLEPVFYALADGLRRNLVEKFGKRPPPGAPPPRVDAADVAGILVTLFGPPPRK